MIPGLLSDAAQTRQRSGWPEVPLDPGEDDDVDSGVCTELRL